MEKRRIAADDSRIPYFESGKGGKYERSGFRYGRDTGKRTRRFNNEVAGGAQDFAKGVAARFQEIFECLKQSKTKGRNPEVFLFFERCIDRLGASSLMLK